MKNTPDGGFMDLITLRGNGASASYIGMVSGDGRIKCAPYMRGVFPFFEGECEWRIDFNLVLVKSGWFGSSFAVTRFAVPNWKCSPARDLVTK